MIVDNCCDHIFAKSIQHFHRKMNSWTLPSIPKWLSWILLFKLAQVYETCSVADGFKTGERNPIRPTRFTLALSSNSLKDYEEPRTDYDPSKVFSLTCSLCATDQSAKPYFWKDYYSDLPFAITPGWGFAYFLVISKVYARGILWRSSSHENETKRSQINKHTMSSNGTRA